MPSAVRWRRVRLTPPCPGIASLWSTGWPTPALPLEPGEPRSSSRAAEAGPASGAAGSQAPSPGLQAICRGPQSQSSRERAARSSRRRPSSSSWARGLAGSGSSRAEQVRSSASICWRPLTSNHSPRPRGGRTGGGGAGPEAGAISTTRPPARRVATLWRSRLGSGCSSRPCTGRLRSSRWG